MENARQRILYYIDNQGLAPKDFLRNTSLKKGVIDKSHQNSGITDIFLSKILEYYTDINPLWLLTGKGEMIINNKTVTNKLETPNVTGYYYPDVSASAGLNSIIDNTELNKIPISIPSFGKDIHFINVFGDSMYPKYSSGEIIGIKEIEYDYLNFGFAYVVIMNNEEVYLKYVKKGHKSDRVLLVSENTHYEPREFHLSQIRSFFMVKGVISKTSM